MITAAQWIPVERVDSQIEWFYNELGIDDEYFEQESAQVISNHIASLYAAKVASVAREGTREEIGLDAEGKDHAIYVDTSERGRPWSRSGGRRYEQRLEEKYLDGSTANKRFRVEAFCSPTNLMGYPSLDPSKVPIMRCYFVHECRFAESSPSPEETDLNRIGDRMFLAKTTQNTIAIYQNIINEAVSRAGPVIKVFDSNVGASSEREKRLVVAFRQRTAPGMFSALSDLYHYYDVICPRKYLDNFSNGITVISMYLKAATESKRSPGVAPQAIEESIKQISKEISLLYCIPRNKFQSLFASGRLSLEETIYAHCVWIFVQHFVNRLGNSFPNLTSIKGRITDVLQVPNTVRLSVSWTQRTTTMPRFSPCSSVGCGLASLLTISPRSLPNIPRLYDSCTRTLQIFMASRKNTAMTMSHRRPLLKCYPTLNSRILFQGL
jgi:glutamate dehydrogenase